MIYVFKESKYEYKLKKMNKKWIQRQFVFLFSSSSMFSPRIKVSNEHLTNYVSISPSKCD